MQDDYDVREHTKEVYAHFGLAYYLSGVFETGIALALLKLDFLSQQKAETERREKKHFDRAQFEADFDIFLHHQRALTLGNLVKRMQQLTIMPNVLKEQLDRAKKRRDFLAHHFFSRTRGKIYGAARPRRDDC